MWPKSDIVLRREILWKARTALTVKDVVSYNMKQAKRFGAIYAETFALVAEMDKTNRDCIAVFELNVDSVMATRYGVNSIEQLRSQEISALRKNLC